MKVLNIRAKGSKTILKNSRKLETSGDVAVLQRFRLVVKIGDLIAEAMDKVGRDGIIMYVDESNGFDNGCKKSVKMQYDKGYVSPYMVSDREKCKSD